ncbi:phosphatase PAP2 family protein [Prescottella subtropica]|uniref:phosphatase PAP2 family protein n=1 Tax=Prescottella subtropica TaxID=2545757 RepID=UPI0010F641F5|nr:phosphatase PAP2 family protein [Prescottella subtropica]
MSVDRSVLQWVVDHRTPWLTDVVTAITHTGGTIAVFAATTVVTLVLLAYRRTADAAVVAGAMLTGWALMAGLKHLFGRARPPIPERLILLDSYSMPSGHAMTTAILVCVLAAVVLRVVAAGTRRIVLLAILASYTLAVGLSRVYLAAHWLTDVLAGWTLGVVWAALWIVVIGRRAAAATHANSV